MLSGDFLKMKTPDLDLILATMEPDELGKNLTGFGVNLICPEPSIYAPSLARVFSLNLIRVDEFYALLTWDDNANFGNLIQVHSDFSYKKTPYYKYFEDSRPRGLGAELRLFNVSPDKSVEQASIEQGWQVIESPNDKEHGLREAFLLDNVGFCWVPSVPLSA